MSAIIRLMDKEFELIRDLVYTKFGINLTEQKKFLMVSRLQKELRRHNFLSFYQYYKYVRADRTGEALVALIDRISTNHTFFYREPAQFNFFANTVLPELKERCISCKSRRIRIWCAGCSTGEEAYTLSMLIHDFFHYDINSWDIKILATDISSRVLDVARTGVYTDENVANLPRELKRRYLCRVSEDEWRITESVKKLIHFGRFNLMREKFPFNGRFAAIFCRNVMIYFDKETRHSLIEHFFEFTEEKGYLFVGHAEAIDRKRSSFCYVEPAIYSK